MCNVLKCQVRKSLFAALYRVNVLLLLLLLKVQVLDPLSSPAADLQGRSPSSVQC